MKVRFNKKLEAIEFDDGQATVMVGEEAMEQAIRMWKEGMQKIWEKRFREASIEADRRHLADLKAAQKRVEVDGEKWIIQYPPHVLPGDPKFRAQAAWPAKYRSRDKAPYAVVFNSMRRLRSYGVEILSEAHKSRFELPGFFYEDITRAIRATIKRRERVLEIYTAHRR